MVTGLSDGASHTRALNVRIARSVTDVLALRPDWERLQYHHNADIDFYLTILETHPHILRPHVIVAEFNGETAAMLVGRIEQAAIECRLGYQPLWRPRVRQLTIIRGGVLGHPTGSRAEALIASVLDSLRRGEAETAQFNGMPIDGDLLRCARRMPGLLSRDLAPTRHLHWFIDLPASLEQFLAERVSAKHRYWMRRMERMLDKEAGGAVAYRILSAPDEVDTLCRQAEAVACSTYQRAMGAGFADTPQLRRCLELAAARGWLRAYLVEVGGRPCAFWIGTLYGGTFHLDFTSYDPEFKRFEPGTVLFLKMVEDLCRLGVRRLDCGSGDAFYKRRFGEQACEEASVLIFGPRLRTLGINAAHTAVGAITRLVNGSFKQTTAYGRLKKLWRLRLAQRVAAPGTATR